MTTTNPSADEISFASDPGLATGDAVFYDNGGGTSIGGLTSGQTYYVIGIDATHVKLASTFNDAIYDQPVFLTSPGSGSNQSLVVKPTGFDLAGVSVPLPIPIGGQLVSVTAAGAGGTNSSGAGAVNLNFVRMNVDAHITNNSNIQATGDVDVEATDTSKIGSGTGSIAISVGGGTAINASVGLNDIANSVKAYVQGSTVHSQGAVNVTATETAQDVNIVIGGAGSGGGNAFGGSFAINFISNTVDAFIAASNGVGMGGTPSVVTAFGALSVTAMDTASIATLAGNVGVSLGGTAAGAAAVAVNDVSDTDTATIDDSTASSGGAMTVSATFAKPTQLPAGLDVQIAAMAVSGAGAGQGAFAGSLSLNWINNTVEAEVSNIAAPQFILAGGKLSVIANDNSTINSLAGAIAIAGVGASAVSVAIGASISFNYLGGDPSNPSTTNNNVVRAAINNVTGSLKASQIDVSATYTGEINNITVAGSAAVGAGSVQVAVGGAVSINIIRNTTDAHISGSPNVTTTGTGADSADVTATDTSTIQALAGGVGITAGSGTASLAAGVSVAVNQIYNTDEAYVENSVLKSAGDVNVTTTSTPTIKALTIGVAIAVGAGSGGFAGSGAGAGSGDTVGDNVWAYIDTSTVSANGTITLSATDSPTIQTIAGALGVGVSVGASGVGASVGISVAVNNEMDNVKAYINNSMVTATGGDVSLTATETSIVDAWTIGGAVGGAGGGGVGVGVGAAGAGSGNFVANTVVASITGNSTDTTKTSGDVKLTATDMSSIEAIAGGLGIGVGVGGAGGAGISLGVAAANNNISDTVQAFVNSSTVTSAGMVALGATENATIKTVTVGGAVAVGAGVEVGVGVAVAGSDSNNTIDNNVDAYIAGGSTVAAQGGSLSIDATDTSIITAGGGGLGVGVGVGPGLFGAGLAAAAGFAVATNDVNNSVLAYVDNSSASATGNSVTIAATESATMTAVTVGGAVAVAVASIGFAGAAAIGVGKSTNTTSNTVEAYLAHGATVTTTTSGDVSLTATDSPILTAKTVAASVSFAGGLVAGTVAISAAIANNSVGDTVETYADNSTINSAGKITMTAIMPTTAMIQATSVAASVAISGAAAGAAFAGAGANSTNTVNDTISSYIDGTSPSSGSTVKAAGNISLSAEENAPITSEVGAGAGSGAVIGGSIGVSLASNTVSSNISAYADNAKVTSTGGQISIGSSSNDSGNTLSVATAIAAALGGAGAGSNATATVSPNVSAYAGSGATLNASGSIMITATTTNTAIAKTFGIAGGFVAIGTSTTTATASGSANAYVDGAITGSNSLTIQAMATDSSDAEATAFAGGVVSGEGAGSTATTSPTVQAYTGINPITTTNAMNVTATVIPTATAKAFGVAVAAGVGIGASVTNATVAPTVQAYVGGSFSNTTATITAGSLTVTATQEQDSSNDPTTYASSVGGAGGLLLGVEATVATASDTGMVQADTNSGVTLPDGNVTIQAMNTTLQSANATAGAAGLIGVGSSTATATSGVTTSANLGTDNETDSMRSGSLSVTAMGSDTNDASSTAGSGGLIAGDAASGVSNDSSTVSAGLGGGSTIYASSITVSANNTDYYEPTANSTNAAAVGDSGAGATATTDNSSGSSSPTSTTVNIGDTNGDDTKITATGTVTVSAQNQFTEPQGGGAVGGAGGIANGSAVSSAATLSGNSTVNLGNNVSITSGTDTKVGGIDIVASSALNTNDTVTLSAGGAIEGASTDSTIDATLTNNVTTGTGDNLATSGNIGLGTYTTVDAQTNSEVNTYGLAAVGTAYATTGVTSNQSVTVGSNTVMTAFGNVNITAGNEPTGAFNTLMTGLSNADSYFKGLFAVPQATAVTTLASNATLTIDSGATLSSGQNVTIGAFPGAPSPSASGTAYYDSSKLSTSASSSTPTESTSSSVTQNGTITAGIYHELDITIPNAQDAPGGFYTDTTPIGVNTTHAPFMATYNGSFSPSTEDQYFNSSTDAAAFDKDVSTTPVGALTFTPLYAAGGIVTVNADSISGGGSITAYGSPTISITNASPDYLIFNAITIPFLPAGEVLFTGAAGQTAAQSAGIALTQSGQGSSPVITINENYASQVGTSTNTPGPGPAVYLTGEIDNLGGQVAITNVDGSVAQLNTINAEQLNITAPNGILVISPSSGVEITGSAPYSEWAGVINFPGGTPTTASSTSPAPSGTNAAAYAANAEFNSSGQYTSGSSFTQALIGTAGDAAYTTSEVFYGGDMPWVGSITHDGSQGTANSDSPVDQSYAISGSAGGNEGYFPVVPTESLTETASYNQANESGASASAIHAAQILIDANLIDLNSAVTVGQPNAWSINLPAVLSGLMATDRTSYDEFGGNPLFILPVAPVVSSDQTITAQYDAADNQIVLENVSASSGGGFFSMQGGIVSTNTMGSVHVNGGLGAVTIDNETGIALVVQNVSAGTNSLTSTVSSLVDIIDTNQQAATQHTLYVYQPGVGISKYQGTAGETDTQLEAGTAVAFTSGTSTSYSPESGLRFQWQLAANLSRNLNLGTNSNGNINSISPGNWVFMTPEGEVNANNPWVYLDNGVPTPVVSGQSSPYGTIITDSSLENDDFYESITGSVSSSYTQLVYYHDGHFGFAPANPSFSDSSGVVDPWYYQYIDSASLTLTNSVKADNPIGIDFSGLTSGSVTINSNAPVILSGNVVNPDGATTITAQGSITNLANATLDSNNLALQATGGSSTVQAVPSGAQQLWNNATGGSFTLSLNVSGQIETAGPLAYNATGPQLQAALNGLPGVQAAVVTGVGTSADPWLINGVSGLSANDQGLTGGSGFVEAVADGEELVSNTASGGTFTITVTSGDTPETTGILAYNASSSDVATALNKLGGVQVTVTGAGTGANPWVISGTGVSNLATNDASLTFQSTLQAEPTGAMELFNNATSGTFTISADVGGTIEVTAPLNYNSSSAQVQAALDALTGVTAVVSGGGKASNPWIITGLGSTTLSVNDSSVTPTISAAPAGAQELTNNATGGTFTISVKVNSTTETTAGIANNATASAVETALNKLMNVTSTVTGSGTAPDPWIISGTGFTVSSVDDSSLTPTGSASTLSAVPTGAQQLSVSSTSGAFTIQMTPNFVPQEATLPAGTSASQLQAALDAMDPSVSATVTGLGTTADPFLISGTGVTTIIAVPFGLSSGGSSTLGGAPSGAEELWNSASGGTYKLTLKVNGNTSTATLAYNASAAAIELAFPGLTVTGLGTAADPWLLSGTGLSQISTNDSGLTGISSVQFVPFVQEQLSNNATVGTFTIAATVNNATETTIAIAYNANASAVASALNKLPGVQVTVTGAGMAADPWLITGTGFTSLATNDSFTGNESSTIQPVPPGPQQLYSTASGGDVTIQITVGTAVRTATFAYNASAATVQAALDAMDPSITAQVTGQGTAGNPWLISGSGVSAITVVTPFGLKGGSSTLQAAPAHSQVLWNTATGGTFTASVLIGLTTETTGTIAYNASASVLAAALNGLSNVSASVTGAGTPTDPWVISGLIEALTTNDSGLAGGVIGGAKAPLNVQTTAGGVLNAQAGNQGVYLNLSSGALIGQIIAGSASSGYGDVVLTGTGDLEPAPSLPANTVNVTGDNLTLTSSAGAIGASNSLLDIDANGSLLANGGTSGGAVTVSALNDVDLEQSSGNLIVNTISSTAGDVDVDVTNGGIYDARSETSAQVLSEAQIEQVWANLQLRNDDATQNSPSSATLSDDHTIAVFENEVDANYLQYWQLLDNGTVQNGTYMLDSTGTAGQTALQLFRPRTVAALEAADNGTNPNDANPTNAQIEAYALGLYNQTVAFFNNNLPANWMSQPDFQTFNPNYEYVATAAQETALTQNSGWTEAELTYTINATGLSAAATGTPVGTTTPNVSGHNVTLDANGSVGELAPPVTVSVPDLQDGNLTEPQKAALVLATSPGDVTLQGTDSMGQTVTFVLGQQPTGVTLTAIILKQTAPLFVAATGTFNATAGSSVYVQSTGSSGQNLSIGKVTAGGEVNITAPANIHSAGTSSTQIVTPGNLTLLAGTGNIGTSASTPLVVQYGALIESVSAGENIYLQQINFDLDFDRIVANGAVELTDLSGGLYQDILDLPLVASSLTFNVKGGVNGIDPSDNMVVPLEIQLSSPEAIVGHAGAGINIDSTAGSLTVGGSTSIDGVTLEGLSSISGDVTLASALSILDGIDRSSGDQTADITANNISLTTGGTTGNIGFSSTAPFYIDSRGKLTATTNQNAFLVETKGNLRLDQVNALFGTVFLTVPSGSIVNGNSGGPNVVAVNAYLSASKNVGTISTPIDTEVSYLEGMATSGSFIVSNTGPAVVGGFVGGNAPGYAVIAGGEVLITKRTVPSGP